MKKDIKVLALIPTRLNSRRLPAKALLPINDLPLIMHVYKRVMLSKNIDDVYICCDDKKIFDVVKKHGAKVMMTSKHHANGTERICEAFKKLKKNYDLVIDVQGDEPLISPNQINEIVSYHLKNYDYDIILPNLKVASKNNTNLVKVVFNKNHEVLYLSRANIPFEFNSSKKFIYKHLSIISFKPPALLKYGVSSKSNLENIEDIELLRALDIGLRIKTITLKGDSFSIDVLEDYTKAKIKIKTDKYFKLYK